jgi:hypothetical protein
MNVRRLAMGMVPTACRPPPWFALALAMKPDCRRSMRSSNHTAVKDHMRQRVADLPIGMPATQSGKYCDVEKAS